MRLFSVILLLLTPLALAAALEERPSIPFQVFLWPGTPNPNLEVKTRLARKTEADERTMVEYVSPTIQFSPDGKAQVEEIHVAERRLSPTYRYYGSGPLAFFRETTLGDGQTRRVPLGAVNLPDKLERVLLLFLPNPKNDDQFLIYPIDNSLSHTKPGEACVHNISGSTVACLFNKKQLLLRAGQQEIVPLGTEKRVNITVRIGAEDDDGDWKERYADQLAVEADDSLTVLIYNKPGKADAFRIMKINNPKHSPAVNDVRAEQQDQ